MLLELVGGALVADAAALEHVGGLRERRARAWANCSIRSTPTPFAATASSVGHEPLDDDRREAERELVDEHDARAGDERLGEHDHLLLAARERARRCAVQRVSSSGNSSSA